MRHSFCGLILGFCSIGFVTQTARAADDAGKGESGAAEGAPLAALPSQGPALYEPLPPPLAPRRRFKWGAEFRIEGAPIGGSAASNAGMGGLGMSLRPRPSPRFAIDIGADFFLGRDYYGERRSERSLSVTPMIFVNPQNRVSVYLLGGLGLSSARVEHADGTLSRYGYFGGHLGLGFECNVSRGIAIDVDVLAFLRGHTDDEVNVYPEFVDPATGRRTNTSQGMLFRLGAVYYW